MNEKNKNVALAVSVIFLLLAIIGGLPYGFYSLLRVIIFICGFFIAWLAYKTEQIFWLWSFVLITILFNPIIPVYLDRNTWVVIDSVVGIFMAVAIFKFKFNN